MVQQSKTRTKGIIKRDIAVGIKNEISKRYEELNNPLYDMGPEIRRMRIKRGWLQQNVAKVGYISLSKYCKFELGQILLNLSEFKHIMKIYELNDCDILPPQFMRHYMSAMVTYFLKDNYDDATRLYDIIKHHDQNAIYLIRFIYATMVNDFYEMRYLFGVIEGVKKALRMHEFKLFTLFAALYLHRVHSNESALALLAHNEKHFSYTIANEAMIVSKIRLMIALGYANMVDVIKYHRVLNQEYIKCNYFVSKRNSDLAVGFHLSHHLTNEELRGWIKEEGSNPKHHAPDLLRSYLRHLTPSLRISIVKRGLKQAASNDIVFVLLEAAELDNQLIDHPEWLEQCVKENLEFEARLAYDFWALRAKETTDVLLEQLQSHFLALAESNENARLVHYFINVYSNLLAGEAKYKEAYKMQEHWNTLKKKWNACF